MTVRSLGDLRHLRDVTDVDGVVVDTALFKYRNLLPNLFRYALWAVAPGGRLVIRDRGRPVVHALPYEIGFNQVSALAARYLWRDAERVEAESVGDRIVYRRTAPVTPDGWSAGIVFSGAAAEVPLLARCVDGLRAQPELGPGEIAICGPAAAAAAVAHLGARYLDDDPPPGRFMIGAKKNRLIARLAGPRVLVLHARVVLEAGALGRFPREFDLATPRVELMDGGRRVPYLDYGIVDRRDGTDVVALRGAPRDYPRHDHLRYAARGIPYIDGGVFAVRRAVHREVPLHDGLAWGEHEDFEWAQRARALGYLVDLIPEAHAVSQTSKLTRDPLQPAVADRAARGLLQGARNVAAYARLKLGRAR